MWEPRGSHEQCGEACADPYSTDSIQTCAQRQRRPPTAQLCAGLRCGMTSPKLCEQRIGRSQSVRRPSTPDSPEHGQAQILERMKPDRVTTTKPEEDRRRRTIIIEKKNSNYGFTLQSYGIHYKKEHEIEMITYVDYVEYDGPAYRAGMREGDVILSINGHDMEKVDHKAMVNFIKSCEPRMRMVVLFEDCVRKVELHMRYLHLQKLLESRTAELDRLCAREREILQGRWKTHSLPARKKGGSAGAAAPAPAASIEDVTGRQLLLSYHYLDPRYQYVLPAGARNNEYVVTWSQGDVRHFVVKADAQPRPRAVPQPVVMQENRAPKPGKTSKHQHRQLCNPCIQAGSQQDNNSLEAYDLASPCCQPKCVPSARRRSRHKHRQEQGSHQLSNHSTPKPRSEKYLRFGSGISSDMSPRGSSIASYSTSLSTDTLWDSSERQQTPRSHSSKGCKTQQQPSSYQTYNPAKPKSWDNLTSKAYGGYGYGYGYLDAAAAGGKTPPQMPSKTTTMPHFSKVVYKGGRPNSVQVCRQLSMTDSTTELLLDTSMSCDCLDQQGGGFHLAAPYKGAQPRRGDHVPSEVTRL